MSTSVTFSYRDGGHPSNDDILFSFIDGHVWLSWPGSVGAVRVGAYEKAVAAMQEFLAQSDLGERLVKASKNPTA
jgi:hypothetical protein